MYEIFIAWVLLIGACLFIWVLAKELVIWRDRKNTRWRNTRRRRTGRRS